MPRPSIASAVEGVPDEVVVERIIGHAGGRVGTVYGKKGKNLLRPKIAGYNNAVRHAPWIAPVDLDSENCAAQLRGAWLSAPAPLLRFRVAVRAVEAWLMADAETIARYLDVPPGSVPDAHESLRDPKDAMVNPARRSRRKSVREDMVPGKRSGRRVGPAWRLICRDRMAPGRRRPALGEPAARDRLPAPPRRRPAGRGRPMNRAARPAPRRRGLDRGVQTRRRAEPRPRRRARRLSQP